MAGSDLTLSVPPIRYVIVHFHIFKNGGSTIESILHREFSQQFATIHGPSAGATLDSVDLAEFLERQPQISALSSHHLRYPKLSARRFVIFDWCFLRHPLDRLQSLYFYLTRLDSTDPLCQHARRSTAAEFLEYLLDIAPHQVSDVQVTQLARAGAFTRPANERDLEQAAAIVRQMAVPGLVEAFDESLVAAEYYLQPAFPTLRLEYIPQNVGRLRRGTPVEQQQLLQQAWGADLYGRLSRVNQLDLELFHQMEKEVRQRLDRVPRFEQRLAEFRSRCAGFGRAATA
jgi:sulfotransferase famil protein